MYCCSIRNTPHRRAALRCAIEARRRVEEQFSDYRNVNGLQVAFSAVVQIDGLPAATRRVRTFEYNVLSRLTLHLARLGSSRGLSLTRALRFVSVFL